ncbi:MAG: pilus assembly protein CpaD [Paracoccus sp. (in: a-proteobacteria)]|uniref:flavin-dependent monooxygenase QhpG n=1 Tax=Paracoccus sp. TaxID=267 RepID=UPI0026E0FC86|nr:NAD(P)-binding protein [Paracoccus sp. (in: a-proteobacteria)]MDO5632037.1 pilus assembly protein CpaD [Paracoccus sp. (in: a-proteobacteria)]
MNLRHDMVILGGGPAGAVSAWLAARDGLSVALIDPDRTPARIEGLSPRLHRWLAGQRLLSGFDGVIGPLPRQVDWGGIAGGNTEYVVERTALDRHLRAMAEQAGARLIRAAGRADGGGVMLDDGRMLSCGWLLDARGRAGAPRAPGRAPATMALSGWLRETSDTPGGQVSTLPDGWLWRAALPDGRVWAQFVTDAAGHGTPAERLSAAAGPLSAAPMVREAAPRLAVAQQDLRHLRIGDAAAAMDPLSGHGQFWAVSSALAAAAVRRTLTDDPQMTAICHRFLTARAQNGATRQARIGRDFIRAETRFADAPFWATRRDFPDDLPTHQTRSDFAVSTGPAIVNGRIAETELLLTPHSPDGVAWFGTISAAEVWRSFQAGGAKAIARRWGNMAPALTAALSAEAMARNQQV